MRFRKTCIGTVLLLLLLALSIGIAQGAPIGSEFHVNTYIIGSQRCSSVAMDADGDFVITWFGEHDGDGSGVYAQLYDSSGNTVGGEFRVNTYFINNQRYPSVAMDADGDFVITWTSEGQDGSFSGVYAQRYDSSGNPVGSEFQVNTYTTSSQSSPSVAMDADGDFVITWSSLQDGSVGIYAQLYDSSGNTVGGEFRVNTYTTNGQRHPSVAMDADGDFVIAWDSEWQDGSYEGVYAQRYDSSGNPVGSEFQVNTYTTARQKWSSVAMDADGDFVITWTDQGIMFDSNGQDGSFSGVYAQRYDSSGNPVGGEFLVNTETEWDQLYSSAAMDAAGNFVITWTSDSYTKYRTLNDIYAQLYDSSGNTVGGEFLVNTYTYYQQWEARVAMDAAGNFVVTWTSAPFQEEDGSGIYAQRFLGFSFVIGNEGVVTTLTTLLSRARDALNQGNVNAFERILGAFVRQVTAFSGNQIDTEYAENLIQWAMAWLEDPGQV